MKLRKWAHFCHRAMIFQTEEVKYKMGNSGTWAAREEVREEDGSLSLEGEVCKVGFCRMGLLFVKIDLQLNKMGSPSDKLDRRICKLNWQSCKMGW